MLAFMEIRQQRLAIHPARTVADWSLANQASPRHRRATAPTPKSGQVSKYGQGGKITDGDPRDLPAQEIAAVLRMPPDILLPTTSDKRVVVASNLPAVSSYYAGRDADIRAALERHAAIYRRQAEKLLSKRELRAAVEIATRRRKEFYASNLALGSDTKKQEVNRRKFRRLVDRDLAGAVPKLRELRALAEAAQADHEKLTSTLFHRTVPGPFPISPGELLPLEPMVQEVRPPFPLFDVSQQNFFPEVRDQSFAVPSIGHVINDLRVSEDESTSVLNGIFGLKALSGIISRSGCGFNFSTPTGGRLRIMAELQCFQPRVSMSLQDNFGFSSGQVAVSVNIHALIVRGTDILDLSQTLLANGLKSDGSDLSATLEPLDDTTPFTFDVTTEDVFEPGTDVQIIAGSEFLAYTALDDMKATVNALLWSRVNKIAVVMV